MADVPDVAPCSERSTHRRAFSSGTGDVTTPGPTDTAAPRAQRPRGSCGLCRSGRRSASCRPSCRLALRLPRGASPTAKVSPRLPAPSCQPPGPPAPGPGRSGCGRDNEALGHPPSGPGAGRGRRCAGEATPGRPESLSAGRGPRSALAGPFPESERWAPGEARGRRSERPPGLRRDEGGHLPGPRTRGWGRGQERGSPGASPGLRLHGCPGRAGGRRLPDDVRCPRSH